MSIVTDIAEAGIAMMRAGKAPKVLIINSDALAELVADSDPSIVSPDHRFMGRTIVETPETDRFEWLDDWGKIPARPKPRMVTSTYRE